MRKTSSALVVAVLAAATSGCALVTSTNGPLSLGEEGLTICTQGGTGSRHTLGDRLLIHTGSTPVTLTKVSLVGPMDLVLLDAALLPEGRSGSDWTLIGSYHGWPPGSERDEGVPAVWQDHLPAVGTVLEPGARWNLAVGLESHAPAASMEAVRVHYEDPHGRRFVVDGPTRLEIRADCELSLPG